MSSAANRPAFPRELARHTKPVFELLVVCTANQCRSPVVQAVLEQGAQGRPGLAASGVHVTSAGTSGVEGVPINARASRALRNAGYEAPRSLSGRLTPELVRSSDLILTASRRHRTQVVRMVPEALTKTFTIREFARYCAMAPEQRREADSPAAERLALAVSFAQDRRGLSFPPNPEDDDIPDPMGRSRWAHRRTVRLIVDSLSPIMQLASRSAD